MAYGDVGGSCTELIITCRTPLADSNINIRKGDALAFCGQYIVTNRARRGDQVFGQALARAHQGETA